MSLAGGSACVRLATLCLIVPFHAVCWKLSRWFVAGSRSRARCGSVCGKLLKCANCLLWAFPIATYVAVRFFEFNDMLDLDLGSDKGFQIKTLAAFAILGLHFLASAIGALIILFYPAYKEDLQWELTQTPATVRLGRWMFWIVVLVTKGVAAFQSIHALNQADTDLKIAEVGHESIADLQQYMFSPPWISDVVQRFLLWGIGFVLFVTDTQFWVVLGCTVLGVFAGFRQRQWRVWQWAFEDAIARIPGRFAEKVLGSSKHVKYFPAIWNRMVQHMQYEDKVNSADGNMLYTANRLDTLDWPSLQGPLVITPGEAKAPELFTSGCACERIVRRDLGLAKDRSWPRNEDARWRVTALARGLTLNMPRPFTAPFFPGLTVLIPHYADSIHTTQAELLGKLEDTEIAPLISWLEQRYGREFQSFSTRMASKLEGWPKAGSDWEEYKLPQHWEKICTWASMRSQTLWRTVAGMMLYHEVLDCHRQVARDRNTCFEKHPWDASEVFRCIVSMQIYPFLSEDQLAHTNKMLEKFPDSLKIAFIDFEAKGPNAEQDEVHTQQQRRYFSCLMDKSCPAHPTKAHQRTPQLRIELPGYPILGDGKGDNQNHSIIFTRGSIIQVIDANQGAYFEQMMMLPCVLGEFRNKQSGLSKSIVGFPEHITSDIGSIGDFAAGAETAFGTLLQRSYSALGARMHYGHPDMMNKTFMMQQGGISKASKTINLSEDIFAGMDFTLRGGGRNIKHAEYFHVSKGRDLGFNTVLTFFAKLSAGTGEQLLTRQMLRIGHVMGLGEFLMFFYAHGGFYLTQYLVSRSVPLLCFLWLLFVLDEETPMETIGGQAVKARADIMATLLSSIFSWLIGLFMLAQTAPLFTEVAMQRGFFAASKRIFKQMITLAPLHFIFQAKVIGAYVSSEIRYGGAAYLPTGRGLPTERRPFIGRLKREGGGSGGLYNDWAQLAFYDGARLLAVFVLVILAGGLDVEVALKRSLSWWCFSVALTISAWLLAPAVFNPYQFAHRYFWCDVKDWRDFFCGELGKHWQEWYEKTQLKPASGVRASMLDTLLWIIFISCWNMVLKHKLHILTVVFPASKMVSTQVSALLPPVFSSLAFCVLLVAASKVRPKLPKPCLAVVASIIALLDLMEGIVSLRQLMLLGWWKSFVAGLVLKYALLSFLLLCSEILFRFKGEPVSFVGKGFLECLKMWLHGHRMAMDMLCSSLIFVALSPFVFFDYMRECMHIHCSLHHLLVFRGQGLQIRASVHVSAGSSLFSHLSLAAAGSAMEDAAPPPPQPDADAVARAAAPQPESDAAAPALAFALGRELRKQRKHLGLGRLFWGTAATSDAAAGSKPAQDQNELRPSLSMALEPGSVRQSAQHGTKEVLPPLPPPAVSSPKQTFAQDDLPTAARPSFPPVDTLPPMPQQDEEAEAGNEGSSTRSGKGKEQRQRPKSTWGKQRRRPAHVTTQHGSANSTALSQTAELADRHGV